MRSWPKWISLTLALIPVAFLVFIVINLFVESTYIIDKLGIGQFFSADFLPIWKIKNRLDILNYGLLPALWNTAFVVFIAMTIALPVSLATAGITTEFQLGFVGRALRAAIGVLSGIPPIIYAFAGGAILLPWLYDTFSMGQTALPEHYLIGGYVFNGDNLIQSGILLALLVIPFITPLIADAIQNVPQHLREASLALGADRWYTLRSCVLPMAFPGLLGAASVGALKAMGDVMIASFAIGYDSRMPEPWFDAADHRTAPLTAVGAGLQGGISRGTETYSLEDASAGFFTGVLLFVLAAGILIITTILQRKLRKKYSPY